MMVRKPKDLLSGLMFLLIGAALLTLSQDYTVGTLRDMGPGYFPLILGGLLIALGAALALLSLRGERDGSFDRLSIGPLVCVLGSALLFGVLLRPAGLLIAVAVSVLVAAAATSKSNPVSAGLLALVLAAGSAFLFVYALGQQLPLFGYWLAGLG